MYVCICNSITESDICEAVSDGVRDLPELMDRTGCSSGCGCCMEFADEVLFTALCEQGKLLKAVATA